jgi:hypothetical protein
MKLAAALLAVAIAASGCVLVPGHGQYRSASASPAKKCPPGHVWSDGACHGSGKGHDK